MQRKFKLIKEYPNCPVEIYSEVVKEKVGYSQGENDYYFTDSEIEDFPEFWEEIIQKKEETHRFYIDEPVTIWRRYWYNVKSELYIDAIDRMKEELSNNELPEDIFDTSELLYDTETSNGMRELFNEQGEEL